MSVNLLLNSNLNGAFDSPFESAYLIQEYKQKLFRINEVFNHLFKYIDYASVDKLSQLMAEWEIFEPESVLEMKITFGITKCLNEALKHSLDYICSEISCQYLRNQLQKILGTISSQLIDYEVTDFIEKSVCELKNRLKGALINWKVYHTRLLRQEYSEKLFRSPQLKAV